MATMNFHHATPVFFVQNLQRSLTYYIEILGFKMDFHEPGIIASVSRGSCTIFLSEGDQGHPGTWAWVGVGDTEALCEEFRSKGGIIRHEPTNYPWALEMQVADPDGNVLRFGSDPIDDEPIGEWLDMHGRRWIKQDGARWVQQEPQ